MYNILICDDEKDIVSALRLYLESEGYKVYEAYTGKQAIDIIKKENIHLLLLDIMMPNMDGLSVTALLRQSNNIPIILLTAKSENSDKILGLNMGADDYITKPFHPMEVIARVKSQIRRYLILGSAGNSNENRITIGSIELDDNAKKVTVDGIPANLTPLEYNILHLLMHNAGRVFSSSQIYDMVWNENSFGSEGTVAVHIRHLREKLEINPAEPRYLKVVWGQGYKFEKEHTNENKNIR